MPLLTFAEVNQQINNKKTYPIYVLHGQESFFIDQLTEAFVENFLTEEEKAFNLEIFYGKETSISVIIDSLCLLYTSDAADERSSVDLGGRRIIKKKKI